MKSVLLLTLAALCGLSACSRAPVRSAHAAAAPLSATSQFIRTMPAASAPLPEAEPIAARIAFDEDHTARVSAPLAGRVSTIMVQPGQHVKAGQALAVLASPDLAAASADEKKAVSDARLKDSALARARLLFDAGVMARKDFEAASSDSEQSAAELERTRQRLRALGAAGATTGALTLASPVPGTVVERQLNPGQEVRPDLPAPLFIVSNLDQLWLIADVPEQLALTLALGQEVKVEADALPGTQYTARIGYVGEMVDPNTRRIPVRCLLANADHKLRPEMFARVHFQGGKAQSGIPLPNEAIVVDGQDEYVFVQVKKDSYERKRVHVARRGPLTSFVDSGIEAGQQLVVAGALLLKAQAGQDVR
ncbi:efflux RND transporter periplasmic adaptor subunit [Pseudoduganella eburnea]|uniref:Efflux RND transporter periplasmic adaptor subunit n=1 Tax=Massilia eburnea TaxID=1776165 RepID=A0A6L6QKS3_9BURK|nr:efflux RND transporter periplasmic adaptor subunit [Massilia eburnea]MTW12761.1 efflux RND transporter periplasmic adaptor subunit [Massilia eburnea]